MNPTTESYDLAGAGYAPDEVATILALEGIATQLGLSQEEFARKHLSVSSTTWSRIRRGKYSAGREAVIATLRTNLQAVQAELSRRERQGGGETYHWFPAQTSVLHAITAARGKRPNDPERLIIVEGASGSGKSRLADEICAKHDALRFHATPSWATDYRGLLRTIATAAGAPETEFRNHESSLLHEQRMLAALRAKRRVMVVDEGQYFSSQTAQILKLILNDTETVIVLLCIPALRQKWMRAATLEADQLLRRSVIIDIGSITPSAVLPFLAELPLGTDAKPAAALLSRAAMAFGGLSTVRRVSQILSDDEPTSLALADVAKAISVVQHLQRKGGES